MLLYVFASSHVGRRQEYNTQSRVKNVMVWVLWLMMLQTCGATSDQCEKRPSLHGKEVAPPNEPMVNDDNWFLLALLLLQVLLFAVIFLCGFVSGRRGSSSSLPIASPATSEASTQKDEAIVPSQLREQLALEQQRSSEYHERPDRPLNSTWKNGTRGIVNDNTSSPCSAQPRHCCKGVRMALDPT